MADRFIGVMLPARIETRFVPPQADGAPWRMKIAVIPDEPWMNRHTEVVSAREVECLSRLWESVGNDAAVLGNTDAGKIAFREFAQQVGAARAWWLINTFPAGANVQAGNKPASRMDGLPDQIEIYLGIKRNGQIVLQRLDPPMLVKQEQLSFDDPDAGPFNLFLNGRWWLRDAGLQQEYELPFFNEAALNDLELVMAVGLGEATAGPLFAAHRNAGVLSMLPLGAPTNTISGAPAADLAKDADTWWQLFSQSDEGNTREDVSKALTGDGGALAALPGGTRNHRALNRQMINLLWPALWGHTLKDVWCVDRALGERNFSFEAGMWAVENMQPEGPLAPLRMGSQPYGMLPVTALGNGAWKPANGDPAIEAIWLSPWLPPARAAWANGAQNISGNVVGADTSRFIRLLGRTPSGSDYGYRIFAPMQVAFLLARAMPNLLPKPWNEWLDFTASQTKSASSALSFPLRPIRRYMAVGARQDMRLPFVEPAPANDDETNVLKMGGSVFFDQLTRIIEIDRQNGIADLFIREEAHCIPLLRSNSLLIRLILNSIALLHAQMGYMRETRDIAGAPLIEKFNQSHGFCNDVQMWCVAGRTLRWEMLFDDTALCQFLGQDAERADQVREWPAVRLYRGFVMALFDLQKTYDEAIAQVGRQDRVKQLLADIERAFRATLDTASHRIDPWITGMAWRRLMKLRGEGRADALGLYAWVDKPYRGQPGPTAGGTLISPSHSQMLTSVILRDKHINDPQAGRWKIDLNSRKVRRAMQFAKEVRAGAHIQEALGRAVERVVQKTALIKQLRANFPIRKEHAGRRVCDGQAVLKSGAALLAGLNLSAQQARDLQELRDAMDAYGDLLVANAVFNVVNGRPERAGETMEAASGLALPPEFDVLRSPLKGDTVNTTVWLALGDVAQPDEDDPQVDPAMLVDAAVATWLEQRVPAGQWLWTVERILNDGQIVTQTVTLNELGFSVADTLAFSGDELVQLAVKRAAGLHLSADESLSPALQAHRTLRRMADLLNGQVTEDDADFLLERLATLQIAAQALLYAFENDPNAALLRARQWGIAPAAVDDAQWPAESQLPPEQQLQDQIDRAKDMLAERIERSAPLFATTQTPPAHQLAQALKDLSGNNLPVFSRSTRQKLDPNNALQPNPTLDAQWLEVAAAVRPALAALEAQQLGSEPFNVWSNEVNAWLVKPNAGAVKQPQSMQMVYSPEANLPEDLAVVVLDSWGEAVPDVSHRLEVAFGFNAPAARAQQAILLAVPPDETTPLDTAMLAQMVLETRELSRARMAIPDDIDPFAALFPFGMVAAQPPTGVGMNLI